MNGRIAGVNRTQLTAQQHATEQLRALAKPCRFRVQSDVEVFPIADPKRTQTSPRSPREPPIQSHFPVPGAAFERWDGQSVGDEEETAKMGQLITVEDAAKLLSCSPAAVRKWLYQKRLRAVKIGRLTRLPLEDIERVASVGFEVDGARGATRSRAQGQVTARQKG